VGLVGWQMNKVTGVALVVAGASIGMYALFSGRDTGADARPQLISAPAIALAPAPTPQPIAVQAVVYVADAAPRVPVGQPVSGLPLDRTGLTREIQLQLERVGCYHGNIDGLWSPKVRQSMKAFTDRVNATLPTEQPDIILLALVRSHKGAACGGSCPSGQAFAPDGRCLPNGLIARTAKKEVLADKKSPAKAAPMPSIEKHLSSVGQPYDKQGRMSLAGPPPPLRSARRPRTDTHSKTRARYAAPAVRVSTSNRFPRWAMKAFNNVR